MSKWNASQVTCYKYSKEGHVTKDCTKSMVKIQSMHTYVVEFILLKDFVAKVSKTKLSPNLLF